MYLITKLYNKIMKALKLLIITIFSCCKTFPLPAQTKNSTLTIVNWNLQCFFDSVTEGTEYTEFLKAKNWGKDAYQTRLQRLSESIKKINADIFVFEEIENQNVIMDISNMLSDFSFNRKKNWNYAVFAKNPGESIGCAVLSRHPVQEYTLHNLDIRIDSQKQPAMRPIIRVILDINGTPLTLLVNHWKSKSGGEEKSEIWRDWQESNLSELFNEARAENQNVIACGDFNRDIKEFLKTGGEANFCLRKLHPEPGGSYRQVENTPVINPWYNEKDQLLEPGSYYFNESFERIDSFFVSPAVKILDFSPLKGAWSTDEGVPVKFQIYSGQGYSDHLPVQCTILF